MHLYAEKRRIGNNRVGNIRVGNNRVGNNRIANNFTGNINFIYFAVFKSPVHRSVVYEVCLVHKTKCIIRTRQLRFNGVTQIAFN